MDILIVVLILLALLSAAKAAISFAPWVPVRRSALARIEAALDLKAGNVCYDLGAGDGRVIFYLARRHKDVKFIGIEIAWPLWLVAAVKKVFLRRANAAFVLRDFYKVDLSAASAVYFFGTPHGINNRFKEKLGGNLRPGSRVVSYIFQIFAWQPKTIDPGGKNGGKIYVYEIN